MEERIRKERHMEWLIAALLLTLGAVVRLLALGVLPYGLNQDEASAGYEALALLRAGVDRNGTPGRCSLFPGAAGRMC